MPNVLTKLDADLRRGGSGDLSPLWLIQRRAMCAAARLVEEKDDEIGQLNSIESPIERLFAVALWSEIKFGGRPQAELVFADPQLAIRVGKLKPLFIEPQKHICGARVDFLISTLTEAGISSLIVECDGHFFHERTAEQAERDRSRDRAFQQGGFRVFRFTGREINRDPCLCAFQVAEWAEKAIGGE